MPDRPALDIDEMEVTPEMIKAGVEAYGSTPLFFNEKENAVEAIYRVMCAAR